MNHCKFLVSELGQLTEVFKLVGHTNLGHLNGVKSVEVGRCAAPV